MYYYKPAIQTSLCQSLKHFLCKTLLSNIWIKYTSGIYIFDANKSTLIQIYKIYKDWKRYINVIIMLCPCALKVTSHQRYVEFRFQKHILLPINISLECYLNCFIKIFLFYVNDLYCLIVYDLSVKRYYNKKCIR